MKLNHSLSAALTALFLAGGLTAASAQTLTVTGTVSAFGATTPGFYTYTYSVTPSGTSSLGAGPFVVNLLIFNFADPNETFLQVGGAGSLGLMQQIPGTGVFTFGGGTPPFPVIANGATETFAFNSADAPGSTVGASGISYNGSGVASINGVTPAPAAAPEPSQTAALGLGVLGLAGMVFTARRRKLLTN